MTKAKKVEKEPSTIVVEIEMLVDNPLSANEEDAATFERLKLEMQANGLVEIPVVKIYEEKYMIMSGHHRVRAWEDLGHTKIEVRVWTPPKGMTPEDEFNMVNNMNAVRGETRRPLLVSKVRENNLDPTKLDVFKYPTASLFPSLSKEDREKIETGTRDKAKLQQLKLAVAGEVAKVIYDGSGEAVICFASKGVLAAVVRVPADKSGTRNVAHALKPKLKKWFDERMDVEES